MAQPIGSIAPSYACYLKDIGTEPTLKNQGRPGGHPIGIGEIKIKKCTFFNFYFFWAGACAKVKADFFQPGRLGAAQ
jgi:hypothetical protein